MGLCEFQGLLKLRLCLRHLVQLLAIGRGLEGVRLAVQKQTAHGRLVGACSELKRRVLSRRREVGVCLPVEEGARDCDLRACDAGKQGSLLFDHGVDVCLDLEQVLHGNFAPFPGGHMQRCSALARGIQLASGGNENLQGRHRFCLGGHMQRAEAVAGRTLFQLAVLGQDLPQGLLVVQHHCCSNGSWDEPSLNFDIQVGVSLALGGGLHLVPPVCRRAGQEVKNSLLILLQAGLGSVDGHLVALDVMVHRKRRGAPSVFRVGASVLQDSGFLLLGAPCRYVEGVGGTLVLRKVQGQGDLQQAPRTLQGHPGTVKEQQGAHAARV
mmetsp:Transcript_9845/g.13837  ORF Transcript_9845/g.13837 Transcript_9845/m.13837 type:complete len:325 (-) Transcript_9845:217-1191(-)